MRGYIAFTRKELIEQMRSYKMLILFVVFFAFGMMSPLLAKLLPDIISSVGIEGMEVIVPEPTYIDGYVQFFKNVNQMGIIIILIVFSGTISIEVNKGTLLNILSKGLSRWKVILAKFTANSLVWTISFLIAAVTNYCYTNYLFKSVNSKEVLISLLIAWLFGLFVLTIIMFSSVITRGNYGGLLLSTMILGGLLLVDSCFKSSKFNPIGLVTNNISIINGSMSISNIYFLTIITVLLIVILIISTIYIFNKKRL